MILDVQFQEHENVFEVEMGKVIPNPSAVVYNREQNLTEEQKAQARANIGVTSGSLSADIVDGVLVVTLTGGLTASIQDGVLIVA